MLSKTYKYEPVGKIYYCLNQNPFYIAWVILFNKFAIDNFFKKNKLYAIKIAAKITLYNLKLYNVDKSIRLSKWGNFCLTVHRGYKIIDLRRKKVSKLMNNNVDKSTVCREIKSICMAGRLSFSPDILNYDIKNFWYEEEYVEGYPIKYQIQQKRDAFQKLLQNYIIPNLEEMALIQTPERKILKQVIKQIIETINKNASTKAGMDIEQVITIRRFVQMVADELFEEKDKQIHLIFSHGDYSTVNILNTKKKLMVIDWESAGMRSPLYDLYNFFLTELYYSRATLKNNFILEITKTIVSVQERLKKKDKYIELNLLYNSKIYLRIYYLERICMLLERNPSKNLFSVILRSIELFKKFDKRSDLFNHSEIYN